MKLTSSEILDKIKSELQDSIISTEIFDHGSKLKISIAHPDGTPNTGTKDISKINTEEKLSSFIGVIKTAIQDAKQKAAKAKQPNPPTTNSHT